MFAGSVAGHLGVENEAVYSATKAALRTYAEAFRAEVRRQGVGVSVVSPGAVAAKFFEHRGAAGRRRSQPKLRLPALLHDGLPAVYRGFANEFG